MMVLMEMSNYFHNRGKQLRWLLKLDLTKKQSHMMHHATIQEIYHAIRSSACPFCSVPASNCHPIYSGDFTIPGLFGFLL